MIFVICPEYYLLFGTNRRHSNFDRILVVLFISSGSLIRLNRFAIIGALIRMKELAERSGVNLRTLQEYDNRAMDINRAVGGTLTALSKVLGCQMEDLLEYDYAAVTEE